MSVDDDKHSGWPLTGTMTGNMAKVWEAILKTKDEWFMTPAMLSDCCMERVSKFCRISSTCGTMQQKMCQGWWAVIKTEYRIAVCRLQRTGQIQPHLHLHHH
jgi:hypothetical protein